MTEYGKDVLDKLLATFRAEADEQLRSMTAALDGWVPTPGANLPAAVVERPFRDAHTLKGAARAVNRRDMEAVCQALESVFAALERVAVAPTHELRESCRGFEPAATQVDAAAPEPRPRTILVVEDSITARTLLTGILESAGYQVAAATDGVEALAALRAGEFDLVVSDVEMSRMDGFELTTCIRADASLRRCRWCS